MPVSPGEENSAETAAGAKNKQEINNAKTRYPSNCVRISAKQISEGVHLCAITFVSDAAVWHILKEFPTLLRRSRTMSQKRTMSQAPACVPTYTKGLQSFYSIWQFVCARDGVADLLPDIVILERRVAFWDKYRMQQKIHDLFFPTERKKGRVK